MTRGRNLCPRKRVFKADERGQMVMRRTRLKRSFPLVQFLKFWSFDFLIFYFLIFVFEKIFSIHGGRRIGPQTTQAGRKSSVPACRYSPRSNSAVSRKTISTFPENPPRILLRFCSVFAPIFIGHPSTWRESCFRNDWKISPFLLRFFLFKNIKEILQSWCAILVHGVGMPRPINLISSDI